MEEFVAYVITTHFSTLPPLVPVNHSTSAAITDEESVVTPTTVSSTTVGGGVRLNTGAVLTEFERDVIQSLVTDTLPSTPHEKLKTFKFVKTLHRQVFDLQYRKELAASGRMTQLRRIIYACAVRQVIINERRQVPSLESLKHLPFFHHMEFLPTGVEEINCLRRFYRAIEVLHEIGVPGSNNKHTYIDVGAMLEGSNQTYAFGGAPSKATIRRSVMFHIVTGTECKTKSEGIRSSSSAGSLSDEALSDIINSFYVDDDEYSSMNSSSSSGSECSSVDGQQMMNNDNGQDESLEQLTKKRKVL